MLNKKAKRLRPGDEVWVEEYGGIVKNREVLSVHIDGDDVGIELSGGHYCGPESIVDYDTDKGYDLPEEYHDTNDGVNEQQMNDLMRARQTMCAWCNKHQNQSYYGGKYHSDCECCSVYKTIENVVIEYEEDYEQEILIPDITSCLNMHDGITLEQLDSARTAWNTVCEWCDGQNCNACYAKQLIKKMEQFIDYPANEIKSIIAKLAQGDGNIHELAKRLVEITKPNAI